MSASERGQRPAARRAIALACAATLLAPSAPSAATAAPAPHDGTSGHVRTLDGWPTSTPRAAGFKVGALRRLVREAKALDSTCYAVVRRGRVVTEHNWGQGRLQPREVFSITKSVTSTLVGIAVRDGTLSLDDPVSDHVPQWRGTESAGVTVRQLLSNTSGRSWSFQSDYKDLLAARNRTRYAIGLGQQFAPDSAWAYNNAAIQVLDAVLTSATGQDTATFAQERLFEPLGMRHTRMTRDAKGSTNVFFGLQTTCLDLARFGQLHLNRGAVAGRRIVSRSWVRAATGRSSSSLNAAYGLLWWLNRPGTLRGPTDPVDEFGQPVTPVTGQLAPRARENTFAAVGLGGQVVFVDRGSRTVVVRLGRLGSGEQRPFTFADASRVVTDALR